MQDRRAVIIYSGGMDSFTLLNKLHMSGYELYPLSVDYGQRHRKELQYAAEVCRELGLPHRIVNLSSVTRLMSNSALTGGVEVPEGHYEEESMKQTVVPNRNMILLSLAIAYAVNLKVSEVYYGAHAGDHAIYPDCRPLFVSCMNQVAAVANYSPVIIQTPFIHHTKGEIAGLGKILGLDYGKAWTCYNGREKACGKCGACQERIEAMQFADISDPMEYE